MSPNANQAQPGKASGSSQDPARSDVERDAGAPGIPRPFTVVARTHRLLAVPQWKVKRAARETPKRFYSNADPTMSSWKQDIWSKETILGRFATEAEANAYVAAAAAVMADLDQQKAAADAAYKKARDAFSAASQAYDDALRQFVNSTQAEGRS